MLKHCIFSFCDGEVILPVRFFKDLFSFCPLKAKKLKFSIKPKTAKWQIIARAPSRWPGQPVLTGVDAPVFAAKRQS
jgi:hypothetical protein